jgi:hypothetical protein
MLKAQMRKVPPASHYYGNVTKSAGSGQPYEYVEIYNTTSEAINLQDYQLQYFTSDFSSPANRWTIEDKIIQPIDSLVLWLKEFANPDVPLWEYNSNYDMYLTPDDVYEIKLTTPTTTTNTWQ